MCRLPAIVILTLLYTSCGGEGAPGRDPEAVSSTAVEEASGVDSATGETRMPAPTRPGSGAARDEPTLAYLEGEWCFHRESGGGESGIVVFEADGTNRSGIVWIENEYRLEEPRDLADFRRSYPKIVEIEPDRFVGLLSGSYRVVFERAPC